MSKRTFLFTPDHVTEFNVENANKINFSLDSIETTIKDDDDAASTSISPRPPSDTTLIRMESGLVRIIRHYIFISSRYTDIFLIELLEICWGAREVASVHVCVGRPDEDAAGVAVGPHGQRGRRGEAHHLGVHVPVVKNLIFRHNCPQSH